MKIRFTLGNILAAGSIVTGLITEYAPQISVFSPATGAKLVSIGAVIALVTKGLASFNHQTIPETKKVGDGAVIFEKTAMLK